MIEYLPKVGEHCEYQIRPNVWISCEILQLQGMHPPRFLARYHGDIGRKVGVINSWNLRAQDGSAKFRHACRPSRTRKDGVRSFRLGATCGWWPCLGGPFVQFYLGFWVHDFWYGTPSYQEPQSNERA